MKKWLSVGLAIVALVATPSGAGTPGTKQSIGKPARARSVLPAAAPQMIAGFPAGWSTLTNISGTATDSEVAVGAIDAKGHAYCAWTEWYGGVGARRDLYFTSNETGSWAAPTTYTLLYPDIDDIGFPALAVTPDGSSVVMAWHDADFSISLMSIKVRERINGTWGAVRNLSAETGASSYVTLSASPVDGTIYAVWMADAGGFALRYAYRDAATGQWSGPAAINGGAAGGQYLPNVHVDKAGTAHLVYIVRQGDAQVWYAKNATPKNPNTWTTPVPVSGDTGLNWTYPKVTADGDGDPYVVWQGMNQGASSILLRNSVSGVWQAESNISGLSDLSETAQIAINGQTGEAVVVWQTAFGYAAGGPVNWDIVMRMYELDKASGTWKWSDLHRLTSYPGHAGEPSLRVSAEGDFHLFFFDNPVGDGAAEVYYAIKMAPRLYAVQSLSVAAALNKVLFAQEKINTISFVANPDNDAAKIQEYRIYRKGAEEPDSTFVEIASLSTSMTKYLDRRLPLGERFAYIVSVVGKDGYEAKSAPVIER